MLSLGCQVLPHVRVRHMLLGCKAAGCHAPLFTIMLCRFAGAGVIRLRCSIMMAIHWPSTHVRASSSRWLVTSTARRLCKQASREGNIAGNIYLHSQQAFGLGSLDPDQLQLCMVHSYVTAAVLGGLLGVVGLVSGYNAPIVLVPGTCC